MESPNVYRASVSKHWACNVKRGCFKLYFTGFDFLIFKHQIELNDDLSVFGTWYSIEQRLICQKIMILFLRNS